MEKQIRSEDGAQMLRQVTKQQWSKHWQVGEEVQDPDQHWEDHELRSKREALTPLKANVPRTAAVHNQILADECCERLLTDHALFPHHQKRYQRAVDSASAHTCKVVRVA